MNHFFKSLCFFTLFGALLQALPAGNPAVPNASEKGLFLDKENFVAVKVGYVGDLSWRAHFKTEDERKIAGTSVRENHFKSKRSRGASQMHFAALSFNVLNQVEAYGFCGAMRCRFSHTPQYDHIRRKYKTPFHPAWGGGLRVIGFYWKRATLGFDGKYLFSNLPITSVRFYNRSVATDGCWEVRRWQVAGALSYQISCFVPYIGMRYSEIRDKIRHVSRAELPFDAFKLKNRQRIGGTVGCGFFPGNYYTINVEGRFYDERAVSVSFDLKF